MATSGSIDYNATANEIISDALTHLGVLGASESVSGEDYTFCLRALNDMVKTWQAQGLHLFKKDEMDIFLKASTEKYTISSTGDHSSLTSYVTEVKTAIGASDTSIDVDSTTNMTAGDNIGIETDSNTIVWTTISSITDTDTLVLDSAIGTTAAVDNNVYWYTTRANRPLDIYSIRYRNDSDIDRELKKVSRDEYMRLSDKDAAGEPTLYYYDPQISAGELYIWPVSTDMSGYLKATVAKTIEDFDSSTDNPDFPVEWVEALKMNLAVRIASAFGAQDRLSALAPLAQELLQGVKGWDSENASLFIGPAGF